MSYVFKQRVGKYTYVYEGESYRNAEGKPRNRRTRIGKVDPETGRTVYTEAYLERLYNEGKSLPQDPEDSNSSQPDDVLHEELVKAVDSSRSYGSAYALESVAEQIGLLPILREVFQKDWEKLFGLASYMVESGDALMHYEDWAETRVMLSAAPMNSQRISDLLAKISETERNNFYERWMHQLPQSEYTALDITSISSWSNQIEDVEHGYNRDHEKLPQINVCMLSGEQSQLPLYQTTYSGSLADVTTLKTTLHEVSAIVPGRLLRVVMDKGFYRESNVQEMMRTPVYGFLMGVPLTNEFAWKEIDRVRDRIVTPENGVIEPTQVLYGLHKVRKYPGCDEMLHVFVYFDTEAEARERNKLTRSIKELERAVHKNPAKMRKNKDVQKYLIVRNSTRTASGVTVSIRQDVVEKELRYKGWIVLIGNQVLTAQEALRIYRKKDIVEEGFDRLKNLFGLHRLAVHSDETAQNKLFIGFIAQILAGALYVRMREGDLLRDYTLRGFLHMLGRLRRGHVRGKQIIVPTTKQQRDGLKKLGVKPV